MQGHRRLASRVALGEIVDHRFAETTLVVEHVVGNADPLGYVAGIVDIATGATGTLAMGGGAMVVKLERDPDYVIALGLQERSRHRRIDAAGHGDYDPRVLRTAFEIKAVGHGSDRLVSSRERPCASRRRVEKAADFGALGRFWKALSAWSSRLGSCPLI